MPSDIDIAELRESLLAIQRELQEQRGGLHQGSRPVDLDEPIGRLSRMDAIQQQKLAEAAKRAAQKRSEAVEMALARMDRGEYGECLSCEEEIAVARLRVRPESTLCLRCQSARENR